MRAAGAGSREADLVELVDRAGGPAGTATVAAAHSAPGLAHRAFSVLLLDPPRRRLLLQRRAAGKTRFPLRWANACCGHPAPGEPVVVAAKRRLAEEIGVSGVALSEIGVFRYRAGDPERDRVEDEHDHVLLGSLPPHRRLAPDPAEVASLRWVGPAELAELLRSQPDECAPWLAGVTRLLPATAGPAWSH